MTRVTIPGKTLIAIAFSILVSVAMPDSHAQQTTERFIPIGMSPGISGKFSYIGAIVSVDAGANSFTMQSGGADKTITVMPSTLIWLDRSKVKKPNIDGKFGNIKAGLRVEVRHRPEAGDVALWVKIEAP